MKKFLGFLLIIAAGLSVFFWWTRNQVIEANEVAAEMREALGMDISTNDVQMGIEQVWAGPETSRPRAPSRRGLVCSASGRGSRG